MKIAGVDEVGLGCLAGPVVSAAVIIGDEGSEIFFKDSKKTSEKNRYIQAKHIRQNFYVGIGIATSEEIDCLNVLRASHLSMERAIMNLPIIPDSILIDGKYIPNKMVNAEAVIKGDTKHQEIAAASIVAKVFRDRLMVAYSVSFSNYSLEKNKGYPTKDHKEAINQFGLSNIHRKSFKI